MLTGSTAGPMIANALFSYFTTDVVLIGMSAVGAGAKRRRTPGPDGGGRKRSRGPAAGGGLREPEPHFFGWHKLGGAVSLNADGIIVRTTAASDAALLNKRVTWVNDARWAADRPVGAGDTVWAAAGVSAPEKLQRRAVKALMAELGQGSLRPGPTMFVVEGGPGCGKSWAISDLARQTRQLNEKQVRRGQPPPHSILFATVTACAGERLDDGFVGAEAMPAITVARMLLDTKGPSFMSRVVRGIRRLQEGEGGALPTLTVVVDEYSMVDAKTADRIAKWVADVATSAGVQPGNARIGWVGDVEQLSPPVGQPFCDSTVARTFTGPVYALGACNRRFGSCPRMLELVAAIRLRDWTALQPLLEALIRRPPGRPSAGGLFRTVCCTNRGCVQPNDRAMAALLKAGAAVTELRKGTKRVGRLVEGALYRVGKNLWEPATGQDGQGSYAQRNGTVGRLKAGLPPILQVTDQTVVYLERLDSGETQPVRPVNKSFDEVLRQADAQTAYAAIGATAAPSDHWVVNVQGVNDVPSLLVMLSRVTSVEQMTLQNFDLGRIASLLDACPCGCAQQTQYNRRYGLPPQKCNPDAVSRYRRWKERLVVQVAHAVRPGTADAV